MTQKLDMARDYLIDQGLLAENEIFIHEMPKDCTRGLLLLDNYSGTFRDKYIPRWRDSTFRFVVRDTDYDSGDSLAWDCANAFERPAGLTVGGIQVLRMQTVNDPKAYRRSAGGYFEFEVDVEVTYIVPAA